MNLYPSPLRDLAAKLYAVAKDHPAYSQAAAPVSNLLDHLSAIARVEEANREIGELMRYREDRGRDA